MGEVLCDRYGFFNGIYGLEQANWANYWKRIIPDGVLGGIGSEMHVYTKSNGLQVYVGTGEAMVDNHRVWITSEKVVPLTKASTANPRYDYIVLRVTYGNTGQSTAKVISITGTAASSPKLPSLTRVTGGTYDLPLASVYVPKNAATIGVTYEVSNTSYASIIDKRYVFHIPGDSNAVVTQEISTSSWKIPYGNGIVCQNDTEYRISTTIENKVNIYLPARPISTFITSICFTAGANYKGIQFWKANRNNTSISTKAKINPAIIGDATNVVSKRYNIIIWYDGTQWNGVAKVV